MIDNVKPIKKTKLSPEEKKKDNHEVFSQLQDKGTTGGKTFFKS